MHDCFDLSGKVALVTGGTGGLGQAICRGLATAGVDMAIGARNTARLNELSKMAKGVGRHVVTSELDVTNSDSIKRFIDKSVDAFGRIDILINCAGMTIKKPILDFSLDEWHQVIDTNLTAVFECSRLVAPIMGRNNGGKIVNFCSMGSYVSLRTSAPYCSAKGGLLQLTKVMAIEWAPMNIQVNAVAPGFFDTPLATGIKGNAESFKKLMIKSPMSRLGEVDELVGTILYLASPASDFVTGVCIPVDGGFLADGI